MSRILLRTTPYLVQWNKLREEIDAFLLQNGLDDKTRYTILLCCEEWFVNIVNHGYMHVADEQLKQEEIKLELVVENGQQRTLELTFSDKGIAFNPLTYAKPQLEQSVEERPIGGLGIFFIRTKMDECQYEYKDGCNTFSMKKYL